MEALTPAFDRSKMQVSLPRAKHMLARLETEAPRLYHPSAPIHQVLATWRKLLEEASLA